MRFLVILIGCVGSPMSESGLVDIISCAVRGVGYIVTEKNFTHNFRVLRL